MRRVSISLMFLTIALALAPALALAQPPVVSEPTSSARMTGATSGSGRGLGVGAIAFFQPASAGTISGTVPNVMASWGDAAGRFHVEGMFGFYHNTNSNLDVGAHGWYHIHAAPSADFSVGGGMVLARRRIDVGKSSWDVEVDVGAQLRAFVVPNVAFLGSLGFAMYFPEYGANQMAIAGSLIGTVGIAYYFL